MTKFMWAKRRFGSWRASRTLPEGQFDGIRQTAGADVVSQSLLCPVTRIGRGRRAVGAVSGVGLNQANLPLEIINAEVDQTSRSTAQGGGP